MYLRKLAHLFAMGAAIIAVCAAPSSNADAGDHAARPAENRATAPALPEPGTYKIDPDHSFAYFGARHHVVGLVRGRFDKITGTISVSKDLAACSVDVSIAVSSISTQNSRRDEDLRSPAYFDVKQFPTMMYQGRGIRRASGNSWTMDGTLTMHGVSKAVALTFTFNGLFPDTREGEPVRAAFHGSAGAKRAEFGMGARDNADELGTSTAPDVEIQIDVEADASAATR